MTLPLSTLPRANSGDRWKFLRDVLVFQLKMFLDNVRDFALMPISLVAALIDLVFRVSAKARSSTRCSGGARIAKR